MLILNLSAVLSFSADGHNAPESITSGAFCCMDEGTQIIGILLAFANVVVTACAAFAGAWATYFLQQRKEREQLRSRVAGNANLLTDELKQVEQTLESLKDLLDNLGANLVRYNEATKPFFTFPVESILQVKQELTFLCHDGALTGHLAELVALLRVIPKSFDGLEDRLGQCTKASIVFSIEGMIRTPRDQIVEALRRSNLAREAVIQLVARNTASQNIV